jgi:predicted ATPase/DNA-binding SARP family transcriptional activator
MRREFWDVELLGGFKARYGDQEISRFPTRKAAALLAYLAYYNDRSHTREELIDRFWPDLDLDAARHNLRQTLFSLRKCLGPSHNETPLFTADRTTLQVNRERITTDVARFEQALQDVLATPQESSLRQQSLITAADLYRGELLPGYYEEWIFTERERLAAACGQALRQLLAHFERSHALDRALETARRLIAMNYLDESAHRAVIRLQLANGNPGEARRQYETLVQLLRAELGVAPSPETYAVVAEGISPIPGVAVMTDALPAGQATKSAAWYAGPPPLPLPLDRFFGRENEIDLALRSLTASTRLLTLTGSGGSGKTRLAIEVAQSLAQLSGRAVYFAALADLADARAIPMQLASALGLPPAGEADPLRCVMAHLENVPAFLILDNFEHLVDAGAEVVALLLQRVPSLRCLVTSRRRLGVAGEHELPVSPLPTPLREEEAAELAAVPSVALYLDRVKLLRPQFALTPENASAIALLCARLEGIPLAIELAAARSGVLSPAQLLAQLEDRFRVLAIPRRPGAVARHRSLRAALDLSYDLLAPEDQSLFRQLCVFRGGWTLAAAEAVTGQRGEPLLSGLERLRGSSLITTVETPHELRFRMLETLREYGQERADPDALEQAATRHAEHYLHWAESVMPLYSGPEATAAFNALETDHDNLRAALTRYMQQQAPASCLRLAGALWRFWLMRGYYQEGRDWLQAALDRSPDSKGSEEGTEETQARHAGALYGLGMLALSHGDIEGQRILERALALYRRLGDRRGTAAVLLRLGRLAISQDQGARARAMLQEGLEMARGLEDRALISEALYQLSYAAREVGDTNAAWNLLQECLAYARRMGNKEFLGDVLNWLGTVALLRGDPVSARHYHDQAIALYREAGYVKGLGWALLGLGNVERAEENSGAARTCFADSLRRFQKLNDRVGLFHALLRCAYVEAMEERHLRAAHLLSAAEALRVETGFLVQPSERPDHARCLEATRKALGSRLFELAWSDAAGWSIAETCRYALADPPS